MRIFNGFLKYREIKSVGQTKVTMMKSKKVLFDMLQNMFKFEERSFLDLYCGSGSVALEALSRGVNRAVMIDSDSEAVSNAISYVNKFSLQGVCRVYLNKVEVALKILGKKGEKFDIIFLNPPYFFQERDYVKDLSDIFEHGLLKEYGIVAIEHSKYIKFNSFKSDLNKSEIENVNRLKEVSELKEISKIEVQTINKKGKIGRNRDDEIGNNLNYYLFNQRVVGNSVITFFKERDDKENII